MKLSDVKSWFGGQSAVRKKIALVQVVYEMSIVLRSMSTTVQKSQLLAAAMLSSELSHRISSELVLRLTDQQGFGDEDLVSMIDSVLSDERFGLYASNVWGQVIKKIDGRAE